MRKKLLALLVGAMTIAFILSACAGIDMKLTFKVDDTTYATVKTTGNESVKMPKDPTKEGYTFDGWYWDKDVWEKPFTVNSLLDAPLTENLTVYAKWKAVHDLHTFGDWTVVTEATCFKEGLRKRECEECGEEETEIIDKIPHAYGEWSVTIAATCTETGREKRICDVCGEAQILEIPKLAHKFEVKYDAANHWKECSVCGLVKDKEEHAYKNQVCTVCGKVYGTEALRYAKAEGGYEVSGIGAVDDGNVVIPSLYKNEPVIAIGYGAFVRCDNLRSVEIPDSVTAIGSEAFFGCGKLRSIQIPNSVETIGSDAFEGCVNLTKVDVDDIAAWCGIKFGNHRANPLTCAKHLYLNGVEVTDLSIPDSVTNINAYTFVDCVGIRSAAIPNSVTRIEAHAFHRCASLQAVVIPNSVTRIDSYAFASCEALRSVAFGIGVAEIDGWAFFGCGNLETITVSEQNPKFKSAGNCIVEKGTKTLTLGCKSGFIPTDGSVVCIGEMAFNGCIGLANLVIPSCITDIDAWAFRLCSGLRNVEIGIGVTNIDSQAFLGCGNLETLIVSEGNPKYESKDNCMIETETKTLLFGCKNSVIPNDGSVVRIGDNAFNGCEGLESITIPEGVCTIGNSAFAECGLKSVIIPDSVTGVGDGAFAYCGSLENAVIGSGVAYVRNGVFRECVNLVNLVIPDGVVAIDDSAFDSCIGLRNLVIPASVESIGQSAFFGCNGLETLAVAEGNPKYRSAENCIIESRTATLILGCKNSRIPTFGVSVIGVMAFGGCTELETIEIPSNITKIDVAAFHFCFNLKIVTISSSVTEIGNSAFDGCFSLTHIKIPESVTRIGDEAFMNCKSLVGIEIPSSVTEIGSHAFVGCDVLENVIIGNGVESIGLQAFCGCVSLKSITIPDGITSIEYGLFEMCTNIQSIKISSNVLSFGKYAFSGCKSLTSIEYDGRKSDWKKIVKEDFWYKNTGDFIVKCKDGTLTKSESLQ